MKPWLPAGLAILIGFPAAAQKISANWDTEFDFRAHKSYEWREHPLVEKHPEVREYTTGSQIVLSQVNQILMGRGYLPADGKPDFYATFFITGKQRVEFETTVSVAVSSGPPGYMWPTGWYSWSSAPAWSSQWDRTVAKNYTDGIVVLDFVDAKSAKLVWRAICRDEVKEWRERDKNITKAVEKALKEYPPKSKAK